MDGSRFRLSSFTPSSFFDFPANRWAGCICVPPAPLHWPFGAHRSLTLVPLSFRGWAGVGERELAEDTGLAKSAYMSSESTLCAELLLDEPLDAEDTLLTLSDLHTHTAPWPARPVATDRQIPERQG